MHQRIALGLSLLAGVAIGAIAIPSLHAQAKPPTYAVIEIAEMTDPEGFKAVPTSPATSAARTAALGGRYVIRTDTATPLDGGAPPKRLVVLAFDSKEKAQGWHDAPDAKEINAVPAKTTKSSAFIVEGFAN